ncbi:MAG: phenol hydroxylase subunit P4 [Proteobacteria bacterium]|nr:phenol hydroxylase subunit P4 [Pseudomonadota bacterium]
MSVLSIGEYEGTVMDNVERFHGNQLVYINWEKHLFFCAPHAFPLPPDMPFAAFVGELLPATYSAHPDWEKIDWSSVEWLLDGEAFTPDMDASLKDNGVGHKSCLRFTTPGLTGIGGSGS